MAAVSPASAARARKHYQTQADLVSEAVIAAMAEAQRAVRTRDGRQVAAILMAYQLLAAEEAVAAMAEEAGRSPLVIPNAFVGFTALGYPLENYVDAVVDAMATELEQGQAFTEIVAGLEQLLASEVADAGRSAAGAEIWAEPLWTNYVRLLNPPSCARCVILAGRVYRDNEGFERHPRCDCVHWPVSDWEAAHDAGLVSSPMEAFNKGLVTGLSAADTKAIEDGADIIAVVNAHRGMRTASIFGRDGVKITTEGTTRYAAWRKAHPNLPYRLRPESIYDIAGDDRAEALRLLRLYGYIL